MATFLMVRQNKAVPRKKQVGPKNNSEPRRFFSAGRQIR